MTQAGIVDQKVVVFAVGRSEYAVSISAVKEVVPWTQPTPVPEAPPIVEGVVDLRGDIIPVVDLGRRFRTTRLKQAVDSRIMVIEVDGRRAGFIVDDVTEVHTLVPGAVTPPSSVLRSHGPSAGDMVVSGILKLGDNRLVVLVDAAQVLTAAMAI